MSQGRMQYPDPEVIPQAKRRRYSAAAIPQIKPGRSVWKNSTERVCDTGGRRRPVIVT
jgi:hypothetical protein